MHVTFALFADAANLSQEGKLNILGVFDALQVGSLPALHPRASEDPAMKWDFFVRTYADETQQRRNGKNRGIKVKFQQQLSLQKLA